MGGLRRSVKNDGASQIEVGRHARLTVTLARVFDGPRDPHLHDVKPRREHAIRVLADLQQCLQQFGKTLFGLDTGIDQFTKLDEIGSQRSYQRLDGRRRVADGAAARELIEADDQAVQFGPHRLQRFVALLACRGSKQNRRRCDEPIHRPGDLHRADDLWHTRVDAFDPASHLLKGIMAERRTKHSEGADPEERKQEPSANAEFRGRSC
jgi:hypothetical protein